MATPAAPQITRELTRNVSQLARLKLTDAEVDQFTEQLGAILGYMDLLSEVDVAGVEPLLHPYPPQAQAQPEAQLATPLREDVAREDGHGLPNSQEGYRVPQVL